MNRQEWLQYLKDHKDKFKWFFDQYFESATWEMLMLYIEKENINGIFTILNNVWFYLPDNKFNIIENPPGWNEFIYLLEEFPE